MARFPRAIKGSTAINSLRASTARLSDQRALA